MKATEQEITYKTVTFYEGDEPIGCGNIEVFNDEIWLNHFAIREDLRGKGYGQKLLQIFIDRYGINTLSCAVKNEIAFHIYKKYGFEVVEEWDAFDEGKAYLMKRVGGVNTNKNTEDQREQEINEMANDIAEVIGGHLRTCDCVSLANGLHKRNYRKIKREI